MIDKDELLKLLDEDPEVRAKLLALMPVAKTAAAPAPEPVFAGPAWLVKKAEAHGPHSKARLVGPKT